MITQIRLRGCQSWDDITIDLSTTALNVIVAENDTGKSVLFKLLKIVGSPTYYSAEDRKSLIRWGCKEATVGLAFDSGNVSFTHVLNNQVIYEYVKAGSDERVQTLEPSPEMLAEAGLLVGNNGKFIANIIDSDQDLMLVNSKLSCNFELIKMIVMCDTLDELDEKLYGLEREFSSYFVRVGDRQKILTQQIQEMQVFDVDGMVAKYELHRAALASLKKLVECQRLLAKFYQVDAKNYEGLLKCVDVMSSLEVLTGLLPKLCVKGECVTEEFVDALQELERVAELSDRLGVEQLGVSEGMVNVAIELGRIAELLPKLVVRTIDFEVVEQCVKSMVNLEKLSSLSKTVGESWGVGKRANEEAESLEQELKRSGKEVECPVYGMVIFDGKECVACS